MSLIWPLCFTYYGNIIGRGFVANVNLCGRVIAIPENEGTWLYGVNPAGVAVPGKNIAEANSELRDTLTRVFVDFIEEANDFDAFKARVEEFFNATDEEEAWLDAVEKIRSGAVQVPEGMKRCPDPDIFVRVTLKAVEQLTPDDNPISLKETQPALAAAA